MESSNAFSALADEGNYDDDGEAAPPPPRSPRALARSGLQRLTPNSRALLAARAARSRLTRSVQDQPQPAVDPQPSYADVLQASLGTRGQTQPKSRTTRPALPLEQQAQAAQASSNATGQQQTSAPQGLGAYPTYTILLLSLFYGTILDPPCSSSAHVTRLCNHIADQW